MFKVLHLVRKILPTAALILLVLTAGSVESAPPAEMIIGVWKGFDGKIPVIFEFRSDKSVRAVTGSFHDEGRYKLDAGTTPIRLDLIFPDQGLGRKNLTIVEFLKDGRLKMAQPAAKRPAEFGPGTIIFSPLPEGADQGRAFRKTPLAP